MSKWHDSYSGYGFGSRLTKAVKVLIIVNIGMFIIQYIFPVIPWGMILGMVPRLILSKFMIWQFFTYMFLHTGVWHLVFNMLMLWFLGRELEEFWGTKQFLFYYFFTGAGAGLCSFLFSINSYIPVMGAFGAIYGLMAACAILFPESVLLLFFIFPIKMKHAIFVLAGINLLGVISGGGGIAYFAHLGGALFGYLYFKNERLRRAALYFSLINWRNWYKERINHRRELIQKEIDRKVDLILEKISKQGVDSLTKEEKRLLEQKSRELNEKRRPKMRAKILSILLVIVPVLSFSILAHNPMDIIIEPDFSKSTITVDIKHFSNNPKQHFIKGVKIFVDDTETPIEKKFFFQIKTGKTFLMEISDLTNVKKIRINAYCSGFGNLEKEFDIQSYKNKADR